MQLVQFNKKFYSVPQTWNELTGRGLVRTMRIIHGKLQPQQKQLKLLQILSGMNQWQFFFCPITDLQEKIYLATFLFTTNTLTKNLIPAYDGKFGPADNFDNLTGAEFAHTEFYFSRCVADLQSDHLDDLVGTLYRDPKNNYDHQVNPDGDHRTPFNDKILGHYAAGVTRWPRAVKLAILTWYAGCRGQLMKDFPRVFGGAGDGHEPQFGLWSIMRGVAEKGNHGSFKDVEKMLLKEMMMELSEISLEADRLETMNKPQPQHHE